MRELTEYIKKAFDYKQDGCYKEAIDYFYKALALDNTSTEIMGELACLYAKLHQYDRAASFYEQVLSRNPDDYQTRFEFALMYKKNKDYIKAEEHLVILFGLQFEQVLVAEELFDVLLKQNKYDKIIEFYNLRANFIKSSLVCYYVGKAYLEIVFLPLLSVRTHRSVSSVRYRPPLKIRFDHWGVMGTKCMTVAPAATTPKSADSRKESFGAVPVTLISR